MNRSKCEEGPSPQSAVTPHCPTKRPKMDSITLFTCCVCVCVGEIPERDGELDRVWTHPNIPIGIWCCEAEEMFSVPYVRMRRPCEWILRAIREDRVFEIARWSKIQTWVLCYLAKGCWRRTGWKLSSFIVFNLFNTTTASLKCNGIVGNELTKVFECPCFMKFCAFGSWEWKNKDTFLLQLLSWLLYLNVLCNS